jgi:hypothetical protein
LEILFSDPYYDTPEWDAERFRHEIASEVISEDPSARVVLTDVGLAADSPSVLVELFSGIDWKALLAPAAITLFFMGDRIEKNVDAWIKLAKRVQDILKRRPPTRVDERAAVLLAISGIEERELVSGFQASVQIVVLTPGPGVKGRLDSRPDALYCVTIHAEDAVWVLVIKSSGHILFKLRQSRSWLDFL